MSEETAAMRNIIEDARLLELYSLHLLGAARNFLAIIKLLNQPEKKNGKRKRR